VIRKSLTFEAKSRVDVSRLAPRRLTRRWLAYADFLQIHSTA